MFLRKNIFNQQGQALLIIVFVMVIALIVGLSIATRTIINLRNTSDQVGAQKALSAAESGVEEALKAGASTNNTLPSGSGFTTKYDATWSPITGNGKFLLNGGSDVAQHDSIYVWVKPYTDNFNSSWPDSGTGSLTFYWGDNGTNCNAYDSANPNTYTPTPAMEISVISGTKVASMITRHAIDPCSTRSTYNHFTSSGVINEQNQVCTGTNCADLNYKYTINNLSQVLLVRVNSVYGPSHIGVYGSQPLAAQGTTILSTGTTNQNTRKISVYQGYPEIPPEFFPNILFQP